MSDKQVPKRALCFRDKGAELVFGERTEQGNKRAFLMKANSGGVMENHWYWGNLAFDLSGLRSVDKSIPVLREHDRDRIVGFTDSVGVGDGIEVEGRILTDRPDGADVVTLLDNGFPWQASVYAYPYSIETVDDGGSAEVNGFSLDGPGTVFRDWALREVSFVTLGADSNTNAVAASDEEAVLINIEKDRKGDATNMSDKETAAPAPVTFTVESVQEKAPEVATALRNEGVRAGVESGQKAERERVCALLGNCFAMAKGSESPELYYNLTLDLIASGASTDASVLRFKDARIQELEKNAKTSPGPNVDTFNIPGAATTGLEGEDLWKHEFATKSEIRREFGTESTYVAYMRATERGLARIAER